MDVQAAAPQQGARKPRFFYGWVIVAIAIVGGAFTSGTSVWGASVFVTHMGDDLGWSRSAFYGAFTIRALAAGALAPVLGPLQDKPNGPRLLMLMSALCLGCALVLLKFVEDLWVFYLVFGGLGALSMSALGEMMTVAVVPKWFVRRRGRAVGIATTGTAMGPLFFPITVQALIEAVGWRDGWLVLGAVTLAVLVPLALLVRTSPEEVGLLPDGDDPSARPSTEASSRSADGSRGELQSGRGDANAHVLAAGAGLRAGDTEHGRVLRQLAAVLPGHRFHGGRWLAGGCGLRHLLHHRAALLGHPQRALLRALPAHGPIVGDGGQCALLPADRRDHVPDYCRLLPRDSRRRVLHHAAAHHRELLWAAAPGRGQQHYPAAHNRSPGR